MKAILKNISNIIVAMLLLNSALFAQDPHFTQMNRIPTYYNPASAGQDVENIRLTMLYRNQWGSVTSPFVTQSLFFDKQVSKVGLGATVINNSSGDAGIRQLYVNGTLSYRLKFRNNDFAGGLQLGVIQKSFDPSKMTFDDQYNPDQGFNGSNPTSESFSYTKLTRPDFGAGILWTYGKQKDNILHPYLGASFQHINQPKETFIESTNSIPRKMVLQGGMGIHVNDQLDLIPMFMYQQQQFSKEMMYGMIAKMPMADRSHVEAGVLHRTNDAVALYAGYQLNSFMLGVSYDINISGVTGGQGAYELTLTYIPKAKIKAKKEVAKEKDDDKELRKPSSAQAKAIEVKTLPDRDGDGIIDIKDKCPDVKGVASLKGCPVKEKKITHSKVVAKKVVNPVTKPEVKVNPAPVTTVVAIKLPNEIEYPEKEELPNINIDSDNDGVPDSIDECPFIKGSALMHGCPDTDGDGIVDSKDPCPFAAGKPGGNGCPEIKIADEPIVAGQQENIEFASNSVNVRGIYKLDIIEPALDSIYDNANYKLVITGHTDGEGDASFNMNLSQARADVVKAIFIKKGMREDRIVTVAYGETMPVANNTEESGRAKNRRVEIHVIKIIKP